MEEMIRRSIEDSITTKQGLDVKGISDAAKAMIEALKSGKKILACGNGGSAADAMHFAGELVCTFMDRKRKALPCIALNVNQSIITAWSNDFSYDTVFSRQVEALGQDGDVLLGISTSGNSQNIIEAFAAAKKKRMTTIGLIGKDGGKMKEACDLNVIVPGDHTARIQESHILIIHLLCQAIDDAMSGP